jgi:hypothetical protein
MHKMLVVNPLLYILKDMRETANEEILLVNPEVRLRHPSDQGCLTGPTPLTALHHFSYNLHT